VWRTNTRGDYWVLDLAGWSLKKLGGDGPASTLMFAKWSPDGGRVGWVRYGAYNIYIEDIASGKLTQLTRDGSRTTINGTFDWVYEEELGLQDGWRWNPDGQSIAYWQLDATGVRDFLLYNVTDSLYAFTTPVQYPKAGQTNSAARTGVVSATGGETRWINIPGDPRNNYIARMEWGPRDGRAGPSKELVIQHLNRLQNKLQVMLADAQTGQVRTVFTEQDSAWVEQFDELGSSTEGRTSSGCPSGAAGVTCISSRGMASRRGRSRPGISMSSASSASIHSGSGSTTRPRRTIRRSAICTG